MKHVPESHQSIVPPPSVILSIAFIAVLMGVVAFVVALAK
jgi:hypothetical protein